MTDREQSYYVQVGKWFQCAHCGVIIANIARHPERIGLLPMHWCGAPWQTKPDDLPPDWVPGGKSAPPAAGAGEGTEAMVRAASTEYRRIADMTGSDGALSIEILMTRCVRAALSAVPREQNSQAGTTGILSADTVVSQTARAWYCACGDLITHGVVGHEHCGAVPRGEGERGYEAGITEGAMRGRDVLSGDNDVPKASYDRWCRRMGFTHPAPAQPAGGEAT